MRRITALPVIAVAALALIAVTVPLLGLPNPTAMDVAHRLSVPSWSHWLGRDEYGRDVLSRLLWGARVSLSVAISASAAACIVGTALGLAGGFLGGVVELLSVRSMDVVLCFPPLLL
ncbi:MAG TPA: peptide ABC transporter permease, partial [Acetobacteraceae bacterium]|nr:peptide ABC transporter permease [Acetobacteraceae bacterium]